MWRCIVLPASWVVRRRSWPVRSAGSETLSKPCRDEYSRHVADSGTVPPIVVSHVGGTDTSIAGLTCCAARLGVSAVRTFEWELLRVGGF